MSLPEACCTVPPVSSSYQPVGSIEDVGNMAVYTVGPQDARKAIIVVYDVFGFHNNTKQFCDKLAAHGDYKVVLPDFFHGEPWTLEKMEQGLAPLFAWIQQVGTWELIHPDMTSVMTHLRSQGVHKFGIAGFCWGAKMAVTATKSGEYAGAALIHPSMLNVADAESAEAPLLILPSKTEMDMTPLLDVLAQKPFGNLCYHQRFDDMHHGWVAARGDYDDELNGKRATEAIQLTYNFFQKVMA